MSSRKITIISERGRARNLCEIFERESIDKEHSLGEAFSKFRSYWRESRAAGTWLLKIRRCIEGGDERVCGSRETPMSNEVCDTRDVGN